MTTRVNPFAHRSMLLCAAAMLAAAGLGGCVSQSEYDDATDSARAGLSGKARAERERDEARQAMDLMRNQLVRAEAANRDLSDQNSKLRAALDGAGKDYQDLLSRMEGLQFGPLDAETDQALAQLAAQYPDLIKYDAARGMLRFAADLTFDSGSDTVRESARSSLSALGNILKSGPAAQYEIIVVGHTDSQRISSGTAKRHPTNMHLSCHRAIAVREVLGSMGVSQDKMQAAGWGEFRPAVANSGNGNTPANRRVEIFLARHTGGSSSEASGAAGGTATPDRSAPPARQPEISK